MRDRLTLLVSCCLLAFSWNALPGAAVQMSAGVMTSGASSSVAIAMVCPSGYKLSQVVASMATTDGSQLTWSSGTSLPLGAQSSPTTSQSYTGTPTGSYYIEYICQTNSNDYCAIQFAIGFYCKSSSSQ